MKAILVLGCRASGADPVEVTTKAIRRFRASLVGREGQGTVAKIIGGSASGARRMEEA